MPELVIGTRGERSGQTDTLAGLAGACGWAGQRWGKAGWLHQGLEE